MAETKASKAMTAIKMKERIVMFCKMFLNFETGAWLVQMAETE